MTNVAIQLVTDPAELSRCCQRWITRPVLALDTEFIRTNTFYPIPALLQVFDGQECSLIDLVAIKHPEALRPVFEHPGITKVLHSCSEDLEVFDRLLGRLPAPLFDTQIAAAFLGHGFSIGYSRLVQNLCQRELSKDASRSDWLQRPLTAEQIEYAAQDVIYLYAVYEHLQHELASSEKKAWVDHCNQELATHYYHNQKPEHYFQRIKNLWRLSPAQQQDLYRLCIWREQEARHRNKPRNHIVRDDCLFDIARRNPQHRDQLAALKTMTPPVLRHHGEALLKLLTDTGAASVAVPVIDAPLPKEAGLLIDQLKSEVEQVASRLNIAAEMLARKKDILQFVSSGLDHGQFQLPASLLGWRKPLIGDRFEQLATHWQQQHP